jgi:hypothetical protein
MKEKILKLFKLSKDDDDAKSVSLETSNSRVFVDADKFIRALKNLDSSDKVEIQEITV